MTFLTLTDDQWNVIKIVILPSKKRSLKGKNENKNGAISINKPESCA